MLNRLKKRHEDKFLFVKALVRNPQKTGAFLPSSDALAHLIARQVDVSQVGYVVELGAGTGALTRGLLNAGLDPQKLVLVEYCEKMATYLRHKFPESHVVCGDAWALETILSDHRITPVHTIISGIPLLNFSEVQKKKLLQSCLHVLSPEGQVLQFTYGPLTPFPYRSLGLFARRVGFVLANFPPATVWQYSRTSVGQVIDLRSQLQSRFKRYQAKAQKAIQEKRQKIRDRKIFKKN